MNNTNLPKLTDRDLELLVCAFRCAEGGFPKVSGILPPQVCFFPFIHHKRVPNPTDYVFSPNGCF